MGPYDIHGSLNVAICWGLDLNVSIIRLRRLLIYRLYRDGHEATDSKCPNFCLFLS